jgi:hypothetical protein
VKCTRPCPIHHHFRTTCLRRARTLLNLSHWPPFWILYFRFIKVLFHSETQHRTAVPEQCFGQFPSIALEITLLSSSAIFGIIALSGLHLVVVRELACFNETVSYCYWTVTSSARASVCTPMSSRKGACRLFDDGASVTVCIIHISTYNHCLHNIVAF